jgi:hypothetical protein
VIAGFDDRRPALDVDVAVLAEPTLSLERKDGALRRVVEDVAVTGKAELG